MSAVVHVMLVGGPADGRILSLDPSTTPPWMFVSLDGDELRRTLQHPLTMAPAPSVMWHHYYLDPEREDLRDRPPGKGEVPVFVSGAA